MFARIRPSRRDERGFTLIELLVVMIIIGILAAIAIPTFLNQRKNGYRAAVKSDLKNAAIAAESYATDHNGSYVGLTTGTLDSARGTGVTADVTVTVKSAAGTAYCLDGSNSALDAGDTFYYDSAKGAPLGGACP